METIELTQVESKRLANRLAECASNPKGVFNEEAQKILKKRGIVTATYPFELTLGGPVPTLSYSLSD